MPILLDGFERHEVTTDDGVRLALFDTGAPTPDAPTLFLVNGLGGNLLTWKHQVAHLRDRYRIATFDYRGLYDSAITPEQKRAGVPLDIATHAADARLVLDTLGLERAVFAGWSMGVQVAFELARSVRDRMEGLILVCGSPGKTLATTAVGRRGEPFILPVMGAFNKLVAAQGNVVERTLDTGLLLKAAKTLGIVAKSIDEPLATQIIRDYIALDFDIYNTIVGALGDHDARDVLPTLDLPVLLIAGNKDRLTPHTISVQMAKRLPNADLVVVKGGSHYVPVEFPGQVNDALTRYLRWSLGHAGA